MDVTMPPRPAVVPAEGRTDPGPLSTAESRYFAVADPDKASVMTFWRRDGDELRPHPSRARYGPTAPLGLRGVRRQLWLLHRRTPWLARVREAIDADPATAARAFARLADACSVCGRTLTDPASRERGVGPDCWSRRDP